LLAPEAAVEVGADAGVVGVAGQLAHMVNVIHHFAHQHRVRLGQVVHGRPLPAVAHHHDVE